MSSYLIDSCYDMLSSLIDIIKEACISLLEFREVRHIQVC